MSETLQGMHLKLLGDVCLRMRGKGISNFVFGVGGGLKCWVSGASKRFTL